ncbi:hypothetical protein M0811_12413 [Anaeramoeba ignava]|uniref:TFIIH p62 subunit N-terminal domain-containing protein n=1 Tax=Anaeramoeba ignava TaxID=1746090 RepID=A0A9Q0L8E8_ANAIG|nr:hypothetical protein M0811_12413 [Anaeramoeba ignava]
MSFISAESHAIIKAQAIYKKIEGIIHLYPERIMWKKKESKSPDLTIQISFIKSKHLNQPKGDLTKKKPGIKIKKKNGENYLFFFSSETKSLEERNQFAKLLEEQMKAPRKPTQSRLFRQRKIFQFKIIKRRPMKKQQSNTKEKLLNEKAEFLMKNPVISSVFRKIVNSVILDREFWKSKYQMIQIDKNIHQKQKTGLSSIRVSHMGPVYDLSSMHFHISSRIIEQIFIEQPMVLKKFEEEINLKQEEFWKQYFEADFLDYRNVSSTNIFRKINKDEAIITQNTRPENAIFESPLQSERFITSYSPLACAKQTNADLHVDLSNDLTRCKEEFYPNAYGNLRDNTLVLQQSVDSTKTLAKINRHSYLVLEASKYANFCGFSESKNVKNFLFDLGYFLNEDNCLTGGDPYQKITSPQIFHLFDPIQNKTFSDPLSSTFALSSCQRKTLDSVIDSQLLKVHETQCKPLGLENPREYFRQHTKIAENNSNSFLKTDNDSSQFEKEMEEFVDGILSFTPNLDQAFREVSNHKTNEMDIENHLVNRDHEFRFRLSDLESIPQESLLKLIGFQSEINEILHNFWISFPLQYTTELDTISRIYRGLCSILEDLQDWRKRLNKKEHVLIRSLIRPLTQQLHHAIEHYDNNINFLKEKF